MAARRIYIIGVRSSAAIATFLGFYFNLLFDNVAMITANTPSEVFESLLRVCLLYTSSAEKGTGRQELVSAILASVEGRKTPGACQGEQNLV